MIIRRILLVLLVLAAVGVMGYLYYQTRAADRGDYTQTVSDLRELMRVDADWSVEALKSQVALNKDFDMIAGFSSDLRILKTKLKNSDLSDPAKSSVAIADQLNKTLGTLEEKADSIERFKLNHAALRNSVRFLPLAADTLVAEAEQKGMGNFAEEVKGVLKDISLYLLAPNERERQSAEQWLSQNIQNAMTFQQDDKNSAMEFIKHANLVLERKELTDRQLEQAVTLPTAKTCSELLDLYTDFHENRLAGTQFYRTLLIAFSGLLLLVLLFFGFKLRQSYLALNGANAALKDANDSLETRVEDRTKEVRAAYERLKGSQAQLVQSGKMAAVGQMVAGVAHEINTPLGYVRSNVEIIEEMLAKFEGLLGQVVKLDQLVRQPQPDDEGITRQLVSLDKELQQFQQEDVITDMKGLISDAQYGLNQITDIVVSLKDFSGIDRAVVRDFDLNKGMDSALKIANNLIKNTAKVVKSYGKIPPITCAPSQINQVFLNLITNAVHAIEESGRQGVLKIVTKADRSFVYASVMDNGSGMKQEMVQHIFEPFYSTKEGKKGTGLGLSISLNIVKEHGGHLQVKSVPDKGTIFQVSLPLKSKLQVEAPSS